MRRFHLFSFILATIAACVLIGLNLSGAFRAVGMIDARNKIGYDEYGFPFAAVAYPSVLWVVDVNVPLARDMNENEVSYVRPSAEGYIEARNEFSFDRFAVFSDLLILLTIPLAFLHAFEFVLRRRDVRAKAEAPT